MSPDILDSGFPILEAGSTSAPKPPPPTPPPLGPGGNMAVATYLPSSVYLGAASGSVYPNFFVPATNTNLAGAIEGIGVVASLTSSTSPYSAILQFNLGTTSTGALTLRSLFWTTSTSTAGTAKFTPNDGVTSANSNIGATSLTAESAVTFTSTGSDVFYQNNTVLTAAASSAAILTVRIDFNSTGGGWVASTTNFQFSVTQ